MAQNGVCFAIDRHAQARFFLQSHPDMTQELHEQALQHANV
jgi:hypothetical protein